MSGEVRGKSKAELYRKYLAEIRGYGDNFQSHKPDAKYKKLCKSLMVQDPETEEWVLRFHFHS